MPKFLDLDGLQRFKSKIDTKLNTKIPAPSTVGTSDQILRSNGDGTTQWTAAASQSEINAAVDSYMGAHMSPNQTITLDDTLTSTTTAAQSAAAGNQVLVTDSQPSATTNKVWIKKTPEEEITIPTMDDHNDLKAALSELPGYCKPFTTFANTLLNSQGNIVSYNKYTLGICKIEKGRTYRVVKVPGTSNRIGYSNTLYDGSSVLFVHYRVSSESNIVEFYNTGYDYLYFNLKSDNATDNYFSCYVFEAVENHVNRADSRIDGIVSANKSAFGMIPLKWENGFLSDSGLVNAGRGIYSTPIQIAAGRCISYAISETSNVGYRLCLYETEDITGSYFDRTGQIHGTGVYIATQNCYARFSAEIIDTAIFDTLDVNIGYKNVCAFANHSDTIVSSISNAMFDRATNLGIVPSKWFRGDIGSNGYKNYNYIIYSNPIFVHKGQKIYYDFAEDQNLVYRIMFFNGDTFIANSDPIAGKGTYVLQNDRTIRFRVGGVSSSHEVTEAVGYSNVRAIIDSPTEIKKRIIDGMIDPDRDLKEACSYSDFVPGGVYTSGSLADLGNLDLRHLSDDPNLDIRWYHLVLPCEAGDEFSVQSYGTGTGGSGTEEQHHQYVFCDSEFNIIQRSVDHSFSIGWVEYDPAKKVVAPIGAKWLIANHRNFVQSNWQNWYSPVVYKFSKNPMVNHLGTYVYNKLPYVPVNDWENYVIAVFDRFIAVMVNNVIKLSTDCGRTWNNGVDVSAILQSSDNVILGTHIYSNGCLALFTRKHAYYIDGDWSGYNLATCYDSDGSVIDVDSLDTQSAFKFFNDYAERKYITVDGTTRDMLVFGNYHYSGDERSYIWYSIDMGHSYKVAFDFGVNGTAEHPETRSDSKVYVDGHQLYIRHVHAVLYYEPKDAFICMTGDTITIEPTTGLSQSGVWELSYNPENDSWSIEKMGVGKDYKWTSAAIWNQKIYYANDNTPGHVLCCSYDDIPDVSKHEVILDNMYNDPRNIIFGLNGDMIVTQCNNRNVDYSVTPEGVTAPFQQQKESRGFYYSADRKNFTEIFAPIRWLRGTNEWSYMKPLTADGHCFFGIYKRLSYASDADLGLLPSICMDNYLRTKGFVNAFQSKL